MRSILIVDADPITMGNLRSIAERQGLVKVILEARNGKEAITAATRSEPDIVVIKNKRPRLNGGRDNQRLEVDGAQITRSILTANSRLRILMVSDDYTTLQTAFEAGVLGYLLTEQSENEFEAAIEQLLLGRTFFSAVAMRTLRVRYHRQPYRDEYERLNPTEVQIVQHVAEGKANQDVAVALGISSRAVQEQVARIMEKLELGSLNDLTRYAIRLGIIEP